MKKVVVFLLLSLLVLIAVVLIRTFNFKAPELNISLPKISGDSDPAVLAEALTFRTIAHKREMIDDSAYTGFHSMLRRRFPLMHSQLKLEKVNDYSLLYTWQGQDPQLQPVIMMAHQDVVPVEYSSRDQWHYDAFGGEIGDGFIYGRGAIDDKGSLISICQGIESLLKKGIRPRRSIYIAFGHDEEIGGNEGAAVVAEMLAQRGVKAWMVLDEGGTLSSGIVPGIKEQVALVGTSEKGYVSLELSTDLPGGHSSIPEARSALEVINQALYRLQENPYPNRFSEPVQGFIDHLGPELPFVQKMAFANTWLFKPVIFNTYQQSAAGAALIHTTQVVTMFNSGLKDNVVPTRAKAVVNYRLLPGDTPAAVLARASEIVADSAVRIVIHDDFSEQASPVSPHNSDQFRFLAASIKAVHPQALVSPYLVLGATDARHFSALSDHIYRFSPIPLSDKDLSRIHGINERVSVQGFNECADFYATLLGNL